MRLSPIPATRQKLLFATLALTALFATFSVADPVHAQNLYVGVGVGPAVRLDAIPTQVRLEQEIGVFVDGKDGFFISFAPSQSFGDNRWLLVFTPRLGYLFSLYRSRGFQFQLGPAGTIPGVALYGCYDDARCDAAVSFHFSVSMMIRLLFADFFGIYLRPVEFEFAFGEVDGVRYVLAGGVQFHF